MERAPRSEAAARRAAWRGTLGEVVRAGGAGLAWGAGTAAGLVAASKVWPGIGLAWWWLGMAGLGAGLAGGVIVGIGRRWTVLRGARALDEHFGTRDSLRSAIELSRDTRADAVFASLAIAEGEARAGQVSPRRAVRIRFGSTWGWAAALVGVATAAGVWLPARAPGVQGPEARAEAERKETLTAIREAASVVSPRETGTAAASSGAGLAREAEALRQVEEELRAGRVGAEEARARAARELEASSARMQKELEESRGRVEADRLRLAEAASSSAAAAGPTGELRRALTRGEIESAARAARELAEAPRTLSAEEREAMARDLEELASAMEGHEGEGSGANGAGSERGDELGGSGAKGEGVTARRGSALERMREGLKEAARALRQPAKTPAAPAGSTGALDEPGRSAEAKREPTGEHGGLPPKNNPPESKLPEAKAGERSAGEPKSPESKGEGPKAGDGGAREPRGAEGPAAGASATKDDRGGKESSGTTPAGDRAGEKPGGNEKLGTGEGTEKRAPGGRSGAGEGGGPESKGGRPAGTPPTAAGQEDGAKEVARREGQEKEASGGASEKREGVGGAGASPGEKGAGERGGEGGAAKEATSLRQERVPGAGEPTGAAAPRGSEGGAREERAGERREGGVGPSGDRGGDVKPEDRGGKPDGSSRGEAKGEGVKKETERKEAEGGQERRGDGEKREGTGAGSARGIERLAEALEEMAGRERDLRSTRELAEKYREQARRLLENSSPEEREALKRLAERLGTGARGAEGMRERRMEGFEGKGGEGERREMSEHGSSPGEGGTDVPMAGGAGRGPGWTGPRGPRVKAPSEAWTGETRAVDARAKDGKAEERVVGRLLDPDAKAERGVASGSASAEFRAAAAGAERAIEEQSVPNQYSELVRRVFGRYVERARAVEAERPAAPAVRDSSDAPAKKPGG